MYRERETDIERETDRLTERQRETERETKRETERRRCKMIMKLYFQKQYFAIFVIVSGYAEAV